MGSENGKTPQSEDDLAKRVSFPRVNVPAEEWVRALLDKTNERYTLRTLDGRVYDPINDQPLKYVTATYDPPGACGWCEQVLDAIDRSTQLWCPSCEELVYNPLPQGAWVRISFDRALFAPQIGAQIIVWEPKLGILYLDRHFIADNNAAAEELLEQHPDGWRDILPAERRDVELVRQHMREPGSRAIAVRYFGNRLLSGADNVVVHSSEPAQVHLKQRAKDLAPLYPEVGHQELLLAKM